MSPSTLSYIFFSETTEPIVQILYGTPMPRDKKKKVYLFGPGHMTKMAAMPIYVKILPLQNQKSDDLETWHTAKGTKFI